MTDDRAAADAELLRSCADDLAQAIEDALGPWVERSVTRVMSAWAPGELAALSDEIAAAAAAATTDVAPRVRALLDLDVDEQPTGPLSIVRQAVRYPTEVLAKAGVPDVVRDSVAEQQFPADRYDLTPGAFRDLGEAVHEPGLRWGAAKAHTVLTRRRAEGRR